jgi:shikimate 5-dehydrogenase
MFLAQGFAQWEIWTKTRPPESAMRKAVIAKLNSRESGH